MGGQSQLYIEHARMRVGYFRTGPRTGDVPASGVAPPSPRRFEAEDVTLSHLFIYDFYPPCFRTSRSPGGCVRVGGGTAGGLAGPMGAGSPRRASELAGSLPAGSVMAAGEVSPARVFAGGVMG